MKTIRVIALVAGIALLLPSCKTRSSFASFSRKAPAATAPQEGEIASGEHAVVGLVSANEHPVTTVGYSTGDVMESNPGTTVLASAGISENRTIRTTAYCHKELDSLPYGMKTADGSNLKFGMTRSAAADWSRFPVGTRFKIKGLPYDYVVDDYGSALVGTDTIDLYKPTFASMNQWGAREVPIEIVEWGCFEKSKKILEGRLHNKQAYHVHEMHDAIAHQRVSKKTKRMPLQNSKPEHLAPAPVSTLDDDAPHTQEVSNTLPRVVINGGDSA